MKNYLQILRETLKAMLSKPMWLMVVASVCITSLPYMNHTALDLPVAVVDEDHSDVSRELVRLLDSAPKVAVVGYDSLPQAKRDLAWRELYAIIVIPLNFEKRLLRGEALVIPYFGDATNRMANGQIQQDISAVYSALTNRYNAALLEREGFTATQAQVVLSPLVGQLTDLFNPGISFAAIVLPGLLSLILQHSLLLGCTRGNIMLRGGTPRYMRQPLSTRFGRYSAQLLIWTVLAMLFYVIWPHLLGYRQSASFFMLLGIVLPFLIAVIALSEFIAELLPTEESVYLTMTFITLPLFYMAGYSWPEQAMPDWVRWLADAIPSTWAIRAIAEMNQMDLPLRGQRPCPGAAGHGRHLCVAGYAAVPVPQLALGQHQGLVKRRKAGHTRLAFAQGDEGMFRSGLSLLVLLGLATLGGCGSVNTLVRDDASAAHDLRLKATACTSLPRVYSGVSYTFCRLNVKTGSPVAPAQADGILEVLALDFALSGVIDTLALPYTSYRQYRDGNLSLAN